MLYFHILQNSENRATTKSDRIAESHRMGEGGRDCWRSFSPTFLPKQGVLVHVTQDWT